MLYQDGTPKGLKAVLIERGVNVTKMKADQMQEMVQNMHDFKYEKTQVEKLLFDHGYKGFLYPSSTVNSIPSSLCGLKVRGTPGSTVTILLRVLKQP